jgi:long-chain acyl-CoA synthetase
MDSIEDICGRYRRGRSRRTSTRTASSKSLHLGYNGRPKGVMLSHWNIMSNVDDVHRTINYGPDRAFSILPVHHSYECTGGLIATFGSGMSVFYGRGLKPRDLLQDMKLAKPTVWLCAPLILEKLYLRIHKEVSGQKGIKGFLSNVMPRGYIKKKIRQSLGLGDIRLIVSGARPCPAGSLRHCDYGLEVIQATACRKPPLSYRLTRPPTPGPKALGWLYRATTSKLGT